MPVVKGTLVSLLLTGCAEAALTTLAMSLSGLHQRRRLVKKRLQLCDCDHQRLQRLHDFLTVDLLRHVEQQRDETTRLLFIWPSI